MSRRKDKKKLELALGKSFSSSRSKLIKNILFAMLNELGFNYCSHCGEPMTLETYSIEHIKPWYHCNVDIVDSFFNLSNIAFSHILCNSSSSVKKSSVKAYKTGLKVCPTCQVPRCVITDYYIMEKNGYRFTGTECKRCKCASDRAERKKKKLDTEKK